MLHTGKIARNRAILRLFYDGQDRLITITDPVGKVTTLAPEAPVFPSRKGGGHPDKSAARRIVRQAAARAGIDGHVSPHWLRHAHASHALERGAPVALVRDTLGHSSVGTTNGYLHARPNDSSARYLAV